MWGQFRNYKVIYRRYAGLFFCVCVDANDNELAYLEAIHLFVEILGACRSSYRLSSVLTLAVQTRSSTTCANSTSSLTSTRCARPTVSSVCQILMDVQVYAILDEIFLAGEIEETSKDVVLARLDELEKLE